MFELVMLTILLLVCLGAIVVIAGIGFSGLPDMKDDDRDLL